MVSATYLLTLNEVLSAYGLGFFHLCPSGHVFNIARHGMNKPYIDINEKTMISWLLVHALFSVNLWALLLTWFNFNPCMDIFFYFKYIYTGYNQSV